MRDPTIARNYASTLLALARRAGEVEGWGAMMTEVALAVAREPRLRRFLESPESSANEKNAIIARAYQDRLPRLFVRFLQAVVSHRRQRLLSGIAIEYDVLVDELRGRVHAQVDIAREPTKETEAEITRQLTRVAGKTVVPHFRVRPEILGGVVVRVGDTVMDGSLRRRLALLRRQMLAPAPAAPSAPR